MDMVSFCVFKLNQYCYKDLELIIAVHKNLSFLLVLHHIGLLSTCRHHGKCYEIVLQTSFTQIYLNIHNLYFLTEFILNLAITQNFIELIISLISHRGTD